LAPRRWALDRDLREAVEIAEEAGTVLLSYFSLDRMATRAKGDRDVVTDADTAAEELVHRRLSDAFPGDGIVGEEGTNVTTSGERRWCVDPLDGTLNYSRTLPIWCVSLSLFNGTRLETNRAAMLTDAFVHLTVDFHDGSMQEGIDDLTRLAPRVLRTRNIGSAALALAYVAAGRLDAMLHRFANSWDFGAGVVLVEEAGGMVTNLSGDIYTIADTTLIAAASPALQADLLGLVRSAAGSRLE
jgi:myo-inositol-1(or 4)-monophosphatase